MQKFKLSNVLLHTSWQFHKAPTLYCSIDGDEAVLEPVPEDIAVCKLIGSGTFDFTTFFNSLSIMKWRRYTVATKFFLHIELKGGACKLFQTSADSYSYYPNVLHNTLNINASDEWQIFDIELDTVQAEVVHAFRLEVESETFIRNTYYYTEVDEASLRDVELALCTTTFKKEEYIKRNIDIINNRLLKSGEDVANHFHMHVVDNGRTLEPSQLENEYITVHPNPNAGGAGGFARGMIEALEQTPKATHVLLMDDDVRISAESIIRTYQLLRIVNNEYKEAFVSGAMMNMDEPEVRIEDIGYVDANGKYYPLKSGEQGCADEYGHMNVLHDMVFSESFTIPESVSTREDMCKQSYAAWWYCVIPSSMIEKNGLPLPFFVRCDDVEYNLRCRPKLMCMNGICVWHEPFNMRYSAAVERYQMMRNVQIGQFSTNMASMTDFQRDFRRTVRLDIRKFNYDDVILSLEGFEDFLKGPSFIAKPGQAESSYLDSLKKQEKFQSFEQAYDEVKKLGIDLYKVTACDVMKRSTVRKPRSPWTYLTYFVARQQLGGQRLAGSKYYDKKTPVLIDGKGYYDPDRKTDHHDIIIAIDMERKRVAIRRVDQKRFKILWKRYKDDLKIYRDNKERLKQEYEAASKILTSVAFWKAYLGLDGRECDERGYGIIGPDEFGGIVNG